MATPYETVYNRFLAGVTDFNFTELDDYTLDSMMLNLLGKSVVMTRKCQHDLTQRDDDDQEFFDDLSDLEIELLALGMTYAWLDQYLNSTEYTLLFVGGKEEKFYSPAQQLAELRGRKNDIRQEMNRLHNYYTYVNNSYFE